MLDIVNVLLVGAGEINFGMLPSIASFRIVRSC